MLPAVEPRVLVHDIDSAAPREAARAAAATTLASLPPARKMLVGLVGWGDGPGLEPAPWTLDGLRLAAKDVGLELVFETFGPHAPAATHRWLRMHAASAHDEDRRPVTLEVPGARRPRRIPRTWIGRHLCLVAPCVHVGRQRLGRRPTWTGPLASAFETLALATGAPGDEASSAVGSRVAAQIFASTTLLLDASWWAPLLTESGPTGRAWPELAPSHLVALDRCLVMGTTSPAESWTNDGPAIVDAWLSMQMGLGSGSGSTRLPGTPVHPDAPEWTGPGAMHGWPTPAGAERRRRLGGAARHLWSGMADKALEALWRVGDRGRGRVSPARLPPAVPGPLARHWHDACAGDFARTP